MMTVLRVLVCEGSRGSAVRLRRVLEHDGDITVAAVCATAKEAVNALPLVQPDVMTMDLDLPGTGGLAAIEEIMSDRPLPILVISAGADGRDAKEAALAAGRARRDRQGGPGRRDPGDAAAAALRQRVRVLSHTHVIRHPRARLRGMPTPHSTGRAASVIGMCGSAGGPYVLARLLRDLPADYAIPILVVQHISAGFTEGLVAG